MRKLWLLAVFVSLATVPVTIYFEKPPDGPVITTSWGYVLSRETVKVTDGSLGYSWNKHILLFKEDGAVDMESINVNQLHRLPSSTEHCRLSYREKWTYDFIGLNWRRTRVLISIEKL